MGPLAVTLVRTIIVFITIIVSMRIMGKRQLGELELNELVVAVLISNLVAQPLQDIGIPLLYGLLPALTLLCCEILISYGLTRSVKFRAFMCGRPSILIDSGQINQAEMRKNRYTLDELSSELRKSDVTDIRTVKRAILETDGTLSILLFPDSAPLSPKHLSIPVVDNGTPVTIISNGHLLKSNLQLLGLDNAWLQAQLNAQNFTSIKDIYYMTVDEKQNIYIAAKEV